MKNKTESNPFMKIKQVQGPERLQSMCPRCEDTGETKILLADIPMFRQVLLCSFYCPKCGETNNQVQFAGKLPDLGVQILFRCLKRQDFDRDLLRSQNCTIYFEQLDLQLPPKNAQITNIQSLLKRSLQDLKVVHGNFQQKQPDKLQKYDLFIQKLSQYCEGTLFPLTIRMRDPSGNSTIKNPFAPRLDKQMQIGYFRRTLQELKEMGYSIQNAEQEIKQQKQRQQTLVGNKLNFVKPFQQKQFMKYEAVGFQVQCEVCQLPGQMKTCRTSVPYFTDIVIMSFSCQYCGHHSTQTKNGGEIGDQALVITLKVKHDQDLKRDLFKSQTCYIQIKQLELQLDYGTLGGVLTTVEGLLQKIHDHLTTHNPFSDSDEQFGQKMTDMLDRLKKMQLGQQNFTLQLVDPLARSFLQNPYYPNEDPCATKYLRQRTFEQNQTLGLNDMKVQNYSN